MQILKSENKFSSRDVGAVQDAARSIYAGLVAGEAERGAAVSMLREAIAVRTPENDRLILAVREERANAVQDSRAADVWVRAMLASAVRGKEFAHLPRLTVKKEKTALKGVSIYRVEVKPEREQVEDAQQVQDEIGKAMNTLRAALEFGIELNEANAQALSELRELLNSAE